MKSLVRNALLGAAGLVALSLPAHAAGSTAVTDTPLLKSTSTTAPMQMAQHPRNENPGGVGFKQSKKKKAKKKK
jgi:hypothetical protein